MQIIDTKKINCLSKINTLNAYGNTNSGNKGETIASGVPKTNQKRRKTEDNWNIR